MGGEVAEAEVKEHWTIPKKPGRKPNLGDGELKEAIQDHLAKQEVRKAHGRRRAPVIAGYDPRGNRGPMTATGARGAERWERP